MISRPTLWTLLWAAAMLAIVSASLALSEGHLIYTLDDPYIHLAVAENILRGGYGVNFAEYSSPSSSVLYPFLVALGEAAGLGPIGPLVLNLIAAGLSVHLVIGFLDRRVLEGEKGSPLFVFALCGLSILGISALALPMTGMEHSWHVLLVLLVFLGLVRVAEGGRPDWRLIGAIVVMPLVRFEGIAFAGAAVAALGWLGRWRAAALSAGLIVALLAVYAVAMARLDLPPLPSSVTSKSLLASQAIDGGGASGIVRMAWQNLERSLGNRHGTVLLLGVAALWAGLRPRREGFGRSSDFVVAATSTMAITAHVLGGSYGWFHRYEVYVTALAIVAILHVHRTAIRRIVRERAHLAQAALLLGLGVVVAPYARAALWTPFASRGIYEQHYQMHRFATGFHGGDVAVNDLGWVSYRNDAFVLDLRGLSSESVRRMHAAGPLTPEAVARIVSEHGIDLAMIYESWFEGGLPGSWRRIAVLETQAVTASNGRVSFFATSDAAAPRLREALARFAPTLPARARLTISEP